MAKVTIEYFGMDGEGRTVTEAKRDAGRKLEAAMSGDYQPEVIVCGKWSILLFRAPSGWGSRLLTDENGAIREGKIYAHCQDDYKSARQSAIHHVAQCGMDWQGIVSPDQVPAIVNDPVMRRDLHKYAAWQRACRYARTILGMDSHDAHTYACGHDREWLDRPWTSEAILAVA